MWVVACGWGVGGKAGHVLGPMHVGGVGRGGVEGRKAYIVVFACGWDGLRGWWEGAPWNKEERGC